MIACFKKCLKEMAAEKSVAPVRSTFFNLRSAIFIWPRALESLIEDTVHLIIIGVDMVSVYIMKPF